MLEFATFLLIFILALVLTIYNQRQASALYGMRDLARDLVAMRIRDRRARIARDLHVDPLQWLANQVNPNLDKPLSLIEVVRVEYDAYAAEIRCADGHRLVVSTEPVSILAAFDRRVKDTKGSSAVERVAGYSARPLLGGRRFGGILGRRVIETGLDERSEWFDLEAGSVGHQIGLDWGEPSRLRFYVL